MYLPFSSLLIYLCSVFCVHIRKYFRKSFWGSLTSSYLFSGALAMPLSLPCWSAVNYIKWVCWKKNIDKLLIRPKFFIFHFYRRVILRRGSRRLCDILDKICFVKYIWEVLKIKLWIKQKYNVQLYMKLLFHDLSRFSDIQEKRERLLIKWGI